MIIWSFRRELCTVASIQQYNKQYLLALLVFIRRYCKNNHLVRLVTEMTSYFLELNKLHLIFVFSSQSLRHFPPSWLGLCPSLFIPLWKSAGPLDYNLLQLFRVRVDNVWRYAWQNAYFQMIAGYFCCLRRYSIAIYLPVLHSSIIQRDLGWNPNAVVQMFLILILKLYIYSV